MTVERQCSRRQALPPPAGLERIREAPLSRGMPLAPAGVGQCLHSLFRDELLAWRQRRADSPAKEVSHA